MKDLSASEILAIRPVQARLLFPGPVPAIKAKFKALAKRWHPDSGSAGDANVFAHIVDLHTIAIASPEGKTAAREFASSDGRKFRFKYNRSHRGDFGEILIGKNFIVHVVPADLHDLALAARDFTPCFADDEMRDEMERFLPRPTIVFETPTAETIFVERKSVNEILLRDLFALAPFDPRHAAWMTTRLINIASWLDWRGIAHGAIGPDTLLVSPADHSIALTGPFLCHSDFGSAPRVLPARTLDMMPRYNFDALSDNRMDPELVRLTIRESLGDAAGTALRADKEFPKPFADWLLMPAVDGARADFPAWERARDASFGSRRFIHWDVDTAALMAA